ncbi:Origin recognition complex [Theobroma cacao]|nr:Origin recognition complex [Theobroma cacao]
MDLSDIARKLDLSEQKLLVRKAAELHHLCHVQFDSSIIGGEVCRAIICLEIAATRFGEVIFDRQKAIKLRGMSEKAYNRSFNSLQNGLNIKTTLDIRELGIQFGCVRLIPFVKKSLSLQDPFPLYVFFDFGLFKSVSFKIALCLRECLKG